MREPKLGMSSSWQEFQEEFELLRALFDGLEHVLIGQYGVKPGEWQRNFSAFADFFEITVGDAVGHIRTQADILEIFQNHNKEAATLKSSIREAIQSSAA